MSEFADRFWDPEFNSTVGFDVLIKRTKDGRETCKDYEEFLKQRSKAERSYGETLIRIARNSGGKEEIGGLKVSWDELIKQTENVGLKHVDLANQLLDESKKVEDFREKQKTNRNQPIEQMKMAQSTKRDWYNKTMQSKRTYEARCKDKDASEEAYSKNKMVAQQKEVEKLLQKSDKAKLAYESAENSYKSSVKTLEDIRQQWEEQMVTFCTTIQHMEQERIKFLRGNMWQFTNICSLQCVFDDQVYDSVRTVLKGCDEMQDIYLFVNQKGTSRKKPAGITFENYYKDQPAPAVNGSNPQSRRLPTVPAALKRPSDEESTYAVVQDLG